MTTVTSPLPPSGPRPPDSRLRWHILASLAGLILGGVILWCAIAVDNVWFGPAGAVLAALLWGFSSSRSSLGYLVPGALFGIAALIHHHLIEIPLVGDYLQTTLNGVIVAITLGLAIALHMARRDGRAQVRRDREAAAVHASNPPESRTRIHVIAGVVAVLLGAGAYAAALELAHPWNVLISLTLLGAAAATGGFSSLSPVIAAAGGAALMVLSIVRGDDPRELAVAVLVLLSGALACRLARTEGTRFERRENAVAPS